jgi:hypothetical protein
MTASSHSRASGEGPRCPFLATDGVDGNPVCRAVLNEVVSPFPPYLKSYCLVARHVECAIYLGADDVAVEALPPESRQLLSDERAAKDKGAPPKERHLRPLTGNSTVETEPPPASPERVPRESPSKERSIPSQVKPHTERIVSSKAAASTDLRAALRALESRHADPQPGSLPVSPATGPETDPGTPGAEAQPINPPPRVTDGTRAPEPFGTKAVAEPPLDGGDTRIEGTGQALGSTPPPPTEVAEVSPRGGEALGGPPRSDLDPPTDARPPQVSGPLDASSLASLPHGTSAMGRAPSDTTIDQLSAKGELEALDTVRKAPASAVTPRLSVPIARTITPRTRPSARPADTASDQSVIRVPEPPEPRDHGQTAPPVPATPRQRTFKEFEAPGLQERPRDRDASSGRPRALGRSRTRILLSTGLVAAVLVVSVTLNQHFEVAPPSGRVAAHSPIPAPAASWSFEPLAHRADQVLVSLVNRRRARVTVRLIVGRKSGRHAIRVTLPALGGVQWAVDPTSAGHGLTLTAAVPFIAARTVVVGTQAEYSYGTPARGAENP